MSRRIIAACTFALFASLAPAQTSPQLFSILSGGLTRFYRVHVPPSYVPGTPTPVVLSFHGGGGNALQFAGDSGLMATADTHGFLLVMPEGTNTVLGLPFTLLTWNAGTCCASAAASNVDDVGFVSDLLDDLALSFSVDENRVYATGLSNGGMMSYRLGLELPDRISAIAPVAAAVVVPNPIAQRPIPVIAIHGALDTNVPYLGGTSTGPGGAVVPSQIDSLAPFLAVNQAVLPPAPSVVIGNAERYDAPTPATGADMRYWWLLDQGHSWPGGGGISGGPFNTDIDANEEIWAFFQAHPRRNEVTDLGGGCGSSTLSLSASLPIIGRPLTLEISGPAGRSGSIVFDLPTSPLSAQSCTFWVTQDALPLAPFTTNGFGLSATTIVLPASALLTDLVVHLQASMPPPMGGVSNGLRVQLAW